MDAPGPGRAWGAGSGAAEGPAGGAAAAGRYELLPAPLSSSAGPSLSSPQPASLPTDHASPAGRLGLARPSAEERD